MTIYTIGYGGRGKDDFLGLLVGAGVELVADVRLLPQRASMGMFVKAKAPEKGIERLLGSVGIGYEWFEELGNPARGEPGMTTFRGLMRRDSRSMTARLRERAEAQRVCLLCAEKDPERCHRKVISDDLATNGWVVVHLI